MKHPFRAYFLPLFPIAAGIIGLLLRLWLFSAIDEKGLLPANHFADSALYILAAITLGVLFPASRKLSPPPVRKSVARLLAVLGCLFGGIGMLFAGLCQQSARFSVISAIACLAGGLILLAMAVLKFFRKEISYGFPAALTAAFMLDAIAQCRSWGSVSQLQEYFFPLMASVFLILSVYHLTLHAAGSGNPKLHVFFSQSAIFFCCTCLNTNHWFLYLGLLFWVAAPLYSKLSNKKEA